MESGAPMPPPHAPPARRAAVPDSAQRALRPMSRPAAYPASGPSPLAALALSMQPGVRSSSPGASSSTPERVHEGGGVLPEGHPQHARRR
ncbi:hypothetical protein HMPREF9463_00176, partial [Collinsella sp. 4_8_47FAA]